MIMLILMLHIFVACIMSIAMMGVLGAGYQQRVTKFYKVMLSSFVFTAMSGIGLLFVTTGTLGRVCAMMSIFTLSVIAVRYYYRRQLSLSKSL